MAIPVARVHLAMAHAALPALLPTPPKWTTKPARAEPSASSSSAGPRSAGNVRSSAGHRSPRRKNAISSPPKPGRADSVERWDAHKKAASSSSSSSSGCTSSLVSSNKLPISRATSAERWDVHKEHRRPQADQRFDDGESSSTGSNDVDTEEILWKPRAIYAGPGFVAAAPEPCMLPMPTTFLVRVA